MLGIEVAGLSDFTCRTHEIAFGEQVARAHTQLAAYHFLVEAVVTVDYDIVDTRLRTFDYTHLERDAVADYIALDRHEVVEQIAAVHIEV